MFIFVNSYTDCCWTSLQSSMGYQDGPFRISTKVTLTQRLDNGRINSSPVSRSPAIIRWSEGCSRSLRIPVEDGDGDVVKCRYANDFESLIYDSFPHGTLDEVMNHFCVALFCIRMWVFFPAQDGYFSLLF